MSLQQKKQGKKSGLSTNTAVLSERRWQAILFDCDCHSIDDVILRLQMAIACSEQQAAQYANTAEKFGCVTFFSGSKEDCERVIKPLTQIALKIVVEPM